MNKGIDISAWQGANVDFVRVKQSGIDFVILKAGGSDSKSGNYTDKYFNQNYERAKAAGLNVGAYYFVGASCKSAERGAEDAIKFADIIKGKQFEYPVCMDFEAPSILNKRGNTDAAITFCACMESWGYYVSIYASDISGFKSRLYLDDLKAYDKWVARYGSSPKYVKSYGIWQYSSKGSVPGIKGNVDMDYSYKNYPQIMRSKHLNGF